MPQEWSIQSRGNMCNACERNFEDGEAFISAIFPDPPGFSRLDICRSCWDQRDESEQTPFSYWKTVFFLPPEAPPEPLPKENAESLLRRMLEEDQAEQTDVIYILALMLERKKTLIEKDIKVDEDNTVRRIYEHKKTGEVFIVVDPRLNLERLEPVQQRVADMLGAQTPEPEKKEQTEDAL